TAQRRQQPHDQQRGHGRGRDQRPGEPSTVEPRSLVTGQAVAERDLHAGREADDDQRALDQHHPPEEPLDQAEAVAGGRLVGDRERDERQRQDLEQAEEHELAIARAQGGGDPGAEHHDGPPHEPAVDEERRGEPPRSHHDAQREQEHRDDQDRRDQNAVRTGRFEGAETVRDRDVDLVREQQRDEQEALQGSGPPQQTRNEGERHRRPQPVHGEARLLAEEVDHAEPDAEADAEAREKATLPRSAAGHVVDRWRRHRATRSCFESRVARQPRRWRSSSRGTRPSIAAATPNAPSASAVATIGPAHDRVHSTTSAIMVATATRSRSGPRASGAAHRTTPAYCRLAYTDDAASTAIAAPPAP